uniref:HTH_48 domain-containing protein n=1 Tax=Haemonchus placei TaxID=6290 RepID=A0A0N4WTS9_HAEPC
MPHDFKLSQLHLRNTTLFLFLFGQEPAEIAGRMKEVYKKVAPASCTIYKWHSKFTSDNYSIEDEDRPRRSMELDLDVLRSQVEADPYQTILELAVTLGDSVHNYSVEVDRQGAKVRSMGASCSHAQAQEWVRCIHWYVFRRAFHTLSNHASRVHFRHLFPEL